MSLIFNELYKDKESASCPAPEYRDIARGKILANGHDNLNDLNSSLYQLAATLQALKSQRHANTVAITSTHLGTGSTTLAVHLSLSIGCQNAPGNPLIDDKKFPPSASSDCSTDLSSEDELAQFFTDDFKRIFQDDAWRVNVNDLQTYPEDTRPSGMSDWTEFFLKPSQQANPRTLLIDANWQRPGLAKAFGIPGQPGLAELLSGAAGWSEVVHSVCGSPLLVIPAGNFQEEKAVRLRCRAFSDWISRIKRHFYYVIIDSCPVLSHTSALEIATAVDGIILVIWAGHTRWETALSAKRQLLSARANIIGVVVNRHSARPKPAARGLDENTAYKNRNS